MRAVARLAAGFLLAPAAALAVSDVQPIVTPDGRIFPAVVLALEKQPDARAPANLIGDPDGLVGVRVRATEAGETVRVSVDGDGWFPRATIDATLPRAGVAYEIFPPLDWDAERLRAAGRSTARLTFSVDGRRFERAVRVHGVEDAPYYARGADLSWIFAAYVDEAHPALDDILAEARASGIVDRFDGYASGDPERVYRQVYAIWFALQQRGIRYSAATPASQPGERVRYQRVRFIDESLADARSNCVDGSVLIASVLRRIGIEPTLVILPQHMLLAFDLDRTGASRAYLETTMLGGGIDGRRKPDDARSFASFERAVERGFATYLSHEDKFTDPDAGAYLLVAIADARARGVKPIGSRISSARRNAR